MKASNEVSTRRTPPDFTAATTRNPNSAGARLQIGTRVHVRMIQKLGSNARVIAHIGEYDENDVLSNTDGLARYRALQNPIIGTYIRDVGDYFAIRVPRAGVIVFKRDTSHLSDRDKNSGTRDAGVVVLVV